MPKRSLPNKGLALVLDHEQGFRMAAAVEILLARGLEVEVISGDFFVGRGLVESGEQQWFTRVRGQGARFHPRFHLEAVDGRAVTCKDRFTGKTRRFASVALIVEARPEAPADTLLEVLRAHHGAVVTVGDARAPRLMGEAILDAHRTVVMG